MQITRVVPQLRTTSLAESIRFYTTMLGGTLEFQHEDFYAGIRLGSQVVHLQLVDDPDPSVVSSARTATQAFFYLRRSPATITTGVG